MRQIRASAKIRDIGLTFQDVVFNINMVFYLLTYQSSSDRYQAVKLAEEVFKEIVDP
jgi:hypothetical protein